MRYIIFALSLCSCGQANMVIVDNELLEYAQRFEQQIGVSPADISMVFGKLENNAVGLCSINSEGRKITVDRTFWENSEEHVREELMFHELGHCAMFLNHVKDTGNNGCPVSIMYPYVLNYCYKQYTESYKEDLRGRRGTRTLSSNSNLEFFCDKNLDSVNQF